MSKADMIEAILAALPTFTPASGAYQNFERWLWKQSGQNLFMIYQIAQG